MMIRNKLLAALSIFSICLAIGCGVLRVEIENTVQSSMQEKFDTSPDYKEYALHVKDVQIARKSGNEYTGIASIVYKGNSHEIPVEIVADEESVIWETENGAFSFILQDELRELGGKFKNFMENF